MDRRNYLKYLSIFGLSTIFMGKTKAVPSKYGQDFKRSAEAQRDIYLFSKVLQWQDYRTIPATTSKLGYDGIDLTLRSGGHIDPSEVRTKLPEFVRICKEEGLKTPVLTTKILSTDSENALEILETAGELGIMHYRMGWYDYDFSRNLEDQLNEFRSQARKLSEINRKYKISGNYQNHAGTSVGAAVWDGLYLVEGMSSEYIGLEYDIRHAMVEGAFSWMVDFEKVKNHIHTIDLKDFKWECSATNLVPINVPLGEGVVDFKKFIGLLNTNKIYTPMSIHVEHDLGGAEKGNENPKMAPEKILAAVKKDLLFAKDII